MSQGLLALLDDIAAIAKVAAASLDDAATQAVKAGGKAAGIVIDDAAVTPKYVVGFAADRELPIIARIAKGSFKAKLLLLLPGALLISAFAPWALDPLLICGGAFLCLEGFGKVLELVGRRAVSSDHAPPADAAGLEEQRVASALRTDVILSAEVMAITLSSVAQSPLPMQAAVLAIVGVVITLAVYGVVAVIVKADDFGVLLARREAGALQAAGRGLVRGMPAFLRLLSLVGVVAMLWVGGGIVVHSLAALGVGAPEHLIQALSASSGAAMPSALTPSVSWMVNAALSAIVGVGVGAAGVAAVMLFKRLRS